MVSPLLGTYSIGARMKVSQLLKVPGAQQYEMRHFFAEAESADIPEAVKSQLTVEQQWRLLQFLVGQQVTMSAATCGWMKMDIAQEIIRGLSRNLLFDTYEIIHKYGIV